MHAREGKQRVAKDKGRRYANWVLKGIKKTGSKRSRQAEEIAKCVWSTEATLVRAWTRHRSKETRKTLNYLEISNCDTWGSGPPLITAGPNDDTLFVFRECVLYKLCISDNDLKLVAGMRNSPGSQDGSGRKARFAAHPRGIAFDPCCGEILVGEEGGVIRRCSLSGVVQTRQVTNLITAEEVTDKWPRKRRPDYWNKLAVDHELQSCKDPSSTLVLQWAMIQAEGAGESLFFPFTAGHLKSTHPRQAILYCQAGTAANVIRQVSVRESGEVEVNVRALELYPKLYKPSTKEEMEEEKKKENDANLDPNPWLNPQDPMYLPTSYTRVIATNKRGVVYVAASDICYLLCDSMPVLVDCLRFIKRLPIAVLGLIAAYVRVDWFSVWLARTTHHLSIGSLVVSGETCYLSTLEGLYVTPVIADLSTFLATRQISC